MCCGPTQAILRRIVITAFQDVGRRAKRPCLPTSGGARPRLALVLGSGGVRSAAALRIVDVPAREGVRTDLLVGGSSGALR